MLAIAVSDARRFIVPDVISLPAVPMGLLASAALASAPTYPIVLHHLAAACAGAGIFYAIKRLYAVFRAREGLGLGDVKLAAGAGAWTGVEGLALVVLLSCLHAISFVTILALAKRGAISATTMIPYGAFLAPSIWIIWFAQTFLDSGH